MILINKVRGLNYNYAKEKRENGKAHYFMEP